jgi:hypothetical protein
MANETTTTTLSELYTEVIQEAIFTFQETSVMKPIVTTYSIQWTRKTNSSTSISSYFCISNRRRN